MSIIGGLNRYLRERETETVLPRIRPRQAIKDLDTSGKLDNAVASFLGICAVLHAVWPAHRGIVHQRSTQHLQKFGLGPRTGSERRAPCPLLLHPIRGQGREKVSKPVDFIPSQQFS